MCIMDTLFQELATSMMNNRSQRILIDPLQKCILSTNSKEKKWLLMFQGQRACIHHVHTIPEDHLLCGPVVFCCHEAIKKFLKLFPDYDCLDRSQPGWETAIVEIRSIPAHQIISWMDAGIQVINYIVCDGNSDDGVSGAILSGNQARQALSFEIPLEPFFSVGTLRSIATDSSEISRS